MALTLRDGSYPLGIMGTCLAPSLLPSFPALLCLINLYIDTDCIYVNTRFKKKEGSV